MDRQFWLERWRENRIGFHQDRVTPMLERHWNAVGVAPGACVLVPLAGKTRDIDWLAVRGHRVIAVELSSLAIEQFFAERGLQAEVFEDANGIHHRAGAIDLICGDAFALDERLLSSCEAIFDRAALIALPPDLRAHYAQQVYARMPAGCRGLLVTLEYPQQQKSGPPFAVDVAEVHARLQPGWSLDLLECKDILAEQPSFIAEGVSALTTSAWRLHKRLLQAVEKQAC
ncbi:MAG: thiopurine S-methyltransferase [Proteobacteria bacterium]|nr:thiopurine S-methyltransferase [Pseudomonadota bacterium]